MSDLTLREATADDLPTIAALNRAAVPAVSDVDDLAMARLLEQSRTAPVVEVEDGGVVAFLIALGPWADYASPNYRFFTERYTDLVYVDRVVVDPMYQRHGIGAMLYDHVEANRGDASVITAEVNVQPPNERSLAFHAARGFIGVGEQEPYGDGVRVRMLVRRFD